MPLYLILPSCVDEPHAKSLICHRLTGPEEASFWSIKRVHFSTLLGLYRRLWGFRQDDGIDQSSRTYHKTSSHGKTHFSLKLLAIGRVGQADHYCIQGALGFLCRQSILLIASVATSERGLHVSHNSDMGGKTFFWLKCNIYSFLRAWAWMGIALLTALETL